MAVKLGAEEPSPCSWGAEEPSPCSWDGSSALEKTKKGVSLSANHVKGVKMYFVRSVLLLTHFAPFYTFFIHIFITF